jgi:hypothetical protein
MEKNFGDNGNDESAEGTKAHKVSELMLRQAFDLYTLEYPDVISCTKAIDALEPSKAMREHAEAFKEYVIGIYLELREKHRNVIVMVEQRLDYSPWAPEGFGTGDVVLVADDDCHVIDLKYGQGVKVSPVNNPQTRLYGLGAYAEHSMLYDIHRIITHIFQPRINEIPEEPETLTVEELLEWGEKEVKPRAELAFKGLGQYVPGEHCKFCKARSLCRANAAYNLRVFGATDKDPAMLSELEISGILAEQERASAWLTNFKKFCLAGIMSGRLPVKGWKVVAGRSNRKIIDQAGAIAKLKADGLYQDKLIQLVGIGDLEEALGKKAFSTVLAEFIVKPEGTPTLAPDTDKRDSLAIKESDYFKEEANE